MLCACLFFGCSGLALTIADLREVDSDYVTTLEIIKSAFTEPLCASVRACVCEPFAFFFSRLTALIVCFLSAFSATLRVTVRFERRGHHKLRHCWRHAK